MQPSTPREAARVIAQPPANDARKSAIVTARRPGARSSVDVPDMRPTQPQVVRASSGGMGGAALAEVATSTSPARKRLRIVN